MPPWNACALCTHLSNGVDACKSKGIPLTIVFLNTVWGQYARTHFPQLWILRNWLLLRGWFWKSLQFQHCPKLLLEFIADIHELFSMTTEILLSLDTLCPGQWWPRLWGPLSQNFPLLSCWRWVPFAFCLLSWSIRFSQSLYSSLRYTYLICFPVNLAE